MDSTPSLRSSPSSPPNSSCPSEFSCNEYSSPDVAVNPYRAAHELDTFCFMATTQESSIPLFALDTVSQSAWSHPTMASLAPNTSAAMPTVLPVEYDSLDDFSPAMSAVYTAGMLGGTPLGQKGTPLTGTPLPAITHAHPPTMPLTRTSLSFSAPQMVFPSSSMPTARGEPMTSVPGCTHIMTYQRFPSPRSVQVPYRLEPAPVCGTDHKQDVAVGYPSETTAVSPVQDAETAPLPTATRQFYHAAGNHQHHVVNTPHERPSSGARVRRQPRRLTTKEEANFQCEIKGCGKLFSRSYNYKAHMETHDEKREYPFPCQVQSCSKKFVRKTDLQRHHQSVHMKERNHRCDYCGRLFARKDTLRRHMDDGCSKRFDIGTLDLRAEGVSNTSSGSQDHLWRAR